MGRGVPADEFPFSVPAVRHLTTLAFSAPVTFFVGENGSGKSTLLEGIAARFLTLTKSRDAPTDSYFLRGVLLVQRNSQFIIATHSPILLGFPGATIYLFAEQALTRTTYLETEHYQITKAFLDRPQRMLDELLRTDDPAEGA